MRWVPAIITSLTWLGCRFSGPSGTGDGPDAPDASPDAAPDAYVPACMADASYSDNGAHRYKAYPAPGVDYDTATDRCAADGAHLVVVDSMEENEYLRTLIDTETWIGLDDLTVEASFQWVTGATSTFRRFTGSEPNNTGGEDCAHMRDDGTWNDLGCEESRRVLCECDPMYRPPPTPPCRKAPTGFQTGNGRRYFPRVMPRTWADAEADCQTLGAHLITINDLDENTDLDPRFTGPHWIGYTDAASEGQFKWSDGSPSIFHRFVAPSIDVVDCAVLQDGGTWAELACTATFPYACECDPAAP